MNSRREASAPREKGFFSSVYASELIVLYGPGKKSACWMVSPADTADAKPGTG